MIPNKIKLLKKRKLILFSLIEIPNCKSNPKIIGILIVAFHLILNAYKSSKTIIIIVK